MDYKYAFLAQPPAATAPPVVPLPPTPPHAFTAIRAWAAAVPPGSPTPCSPQSTRRASVSSTASVSSPPRLASRRSSFAHAPPADLTALGYTSVFVHLPKTPTTPSPLLRAFDLKHRRPRPPPAEKDSMPKSTAMRRFRSLSILRPRSKQQHERQCDAPPPSPSKTAASSKNSKPKMAKKAKAAAPPLPPFSPLSLSPSSPAEICAASIARRKRAKYAYVRPPPPLAAELAVMQFTDGGSMEKNVRRAMEHHARLAAEAGAPGVAVAHTDAAGGVWWDPDEEMEYAHLLAGEVPLDKARMEWEAFDSVSLLAPDAGPRRASLTPSLASSLDPLNLVPLPEHEDRTCIPLDDRALASRRIGGPALGPVLSLPARPRRVAPHLARACFVADPDALQAFAFSADEFKENLSPNPSSSPSSSPGHPKGRARRRPAPLMLAQPRSAHARARAQTHVDPASKTHGVQLVGSPPAVQSQAARAEFLAASFVPVPVVTSQPTLPLALTQPRTPAVGTHAPPPPLSPAASMMRGMRGLFQRRPTVVANIA